MGKRIRQLLRITGVVTALLFLLLAGWVTYVYLNRPPYLIPDTSEWHTGDIFFSVGDSWESVAVRSITGAKRFELSDSTPSHCGIVVRDSGVVKLAHESTTAKHIVLETPEEYLKNNGSYCLYVARPHGAPDSAEIRPVLDSLLNKSVPFDFDFDHSDDRALYCTELVVAAYERGGYKQFSSLRNQKYIYPEDLLKFCRKK